MNTFNTIGQQVTAAKAIGPSTRGAVSWFGSNWQAELAADESARPAAGEEATVVSVKNLPLSSK